MILINGKYSYLQKMHDRNNTLDILTVLMLEGWSHDSRSRLARAKQTLVLQSMERLVINNLVVTKLILILSLLKSSDTNRNHEKATRFENTEIFSITTQMYLTDSTYKIKYRSRTSLSLR